MRFLRAPGTNLTFNKCTCICIWDHIITLKLFSQTHHPIHTFTEKHNTYLTTLQNKLIFSKSLLSSKYSHISFSSTTSLFPQLQMAHNSQYSSLFFYKINLTLTQLNRIRIRHLVSLIPANPNLTKSKSINTFFYKFQTRIDLNYHIYKQIWQQK
jgi:hypothetical protein